jgi:hypothetical protein
VRAGRRTEMAALSAGSYRQRGAVPAAPDAWGRRDATTWRVGQLGYTPQEADGSDALGGGWNGGGGAFR